MSITANPNKLNECAILGDRLDLYEMGLDTQRETLEQQGIKARQNIRVGKIILLSLTLALLAVAFGLGAWIY